MVRLSSAVAVVAILTAIAAPVDSARSQSVGGDGYLFGRPVATFSLRGGVGRPNATGSIFDFASRRLTLSPNDYIGVAYGADVGVPITQRFELQLGVLTSGRRVGSEDRVYVEEVNGRDVPIEQSTKLVRTAISGGLRYNLRPAGRSISRLAWVPSAFTPYVAAGGGALWYRYRQAGDFVDYQSSNLDIFTSRFTTDGWTRLAYVAGGATWSLSQVLGLTTELRYDHASAPVRGDFDGFSRVSLSGLGLTAGLTIRMQ